MHLHQYDIRQLDRRYRATLINSLAGVRPAVMVGTRSVEGRSNLAIFNSIVHIGADPAMYGLLFRPDTVRRDTLTNILETGQYTFNYIHSDLYRQAHATSAKFGPEESEFDACGFKAVYHDGFPAPFVNGAIASFGLKMETRIDIALNGTIMIIGSIMQLHASDELVTVDGFFNHAKANVLTVAGLDAYFRPELLGRLSYARPGEPLTDLPV
ncbi:MAG: flavin reductase family protein [Bacteroidota bacterium]